ncbi:MAG: ferredoxin [Thermoleophilaceae bacterium]|nr:ferredoxin [Thermoleophilaceae bacterium]
MADGMFIQVEVDESVRGDAELAQKLADACPVDIFENAGGRVEIVPANLDECVLCELCIHAAPPGAVRVRKLYSGEVLQSAD